MLTDDRIRKALIKGCRSTNVPVVNVNVGQVVQVLGLDVVENTNLFNWVVTVQDTAIKKKRPGSVIPESSAVHEYGLGEVNREQLLELLENPPITSYPSYGPNSDEASV